MPELSVFHLAVLEKRAQLALAVYYTLVIPCTQYVTIQYTTLQQPEACSPIRCLRGCPLEEPGAHAPAGVRLPLLGPAGGEDGGVHAGACLSRVSWLKSLLRQISKPRLQSAKGPCSRS